MSHKKQFSGTSKSRQFYDRKIQTYGYSRTIAMGKVIPKDWQYVRIWPLTKTDKKIVVEIEKLLGGESNAKAKDE